MLDYTNAAIEKIKNDFVKISNFFTGAIKASLVIYLLYTLISKTGKLYLNIPLFIISLFDLSFYLYYIEKNLNKKTKRSVSTAIKWTRRGIKLFNIALIIYSIILTAQNISAVALIFSALTLTSWILDIVFFFLSKFIIPWLEYIVIGVQTDLNPIVKIVNKFQEKDGNVVLNGTLPSPIREELTQIVTEKKRQEELYEAEIKASEKQAKKDAKAQKKQDKKMKKQDKKAAKRNHTHSVSGEIAASKDDK